MAEAKKVGQVKLIDVRGSFLRLFEPSKSTEEGRETFKGNFLIDVSTPNGKKNQKACEAMITEIKKLTWKDKWDKVKIKEDRICYRDGDSFVGAESGEIYDGYEDMMVVVSANQSRPTVIGRNREQLVEKDGVIYSGCYVNAIVRFYAVTDQKKGGNGIFASLEGVQFVRKGEAFGSAPLDADEFDDLGDDEEGDDGLEQEEERKPSGKGKPTRKPKDDDDDDDLI